MKIVNVAAMLMLLNIYASAQNATDTISGKLSLDTVSIISTGYQRIPKDRATGSFESINNKLLSLQVSPDILSRLESVSTILFDKSGYSLRPSVTVRGVSSINGPKDPLIILDNFPFEGNISSVNPNIIESITILKDAAAASIWGARAGNGVIVITTKKGRYGQPLQIDFSMNTTVIEKPDLFSIPVMNSSDIIDFEKWLFSNGYRFSDTLNSGRPKFSPVYETLFRQRSGIISAQEAEEQINKFRKNDVRNDYGRYMYQPGFNQQYAISAYGGSQKIAYRFFAGFDKNRNVLSAEYSRLSLRMENRFRINNKINATAVLAYTNTTDKSGKQAYSSSGSDGYNYVMLADNDGKAVPQVKYRQTYLDTAGAGKLLDWNYYPLEDYKHTARNTQTNHLIGNFNFQYQVYKDLLFDVSYQWEAQQSGAKYLQDINSYYTRDLVNKFSQINRTTNVVSYIIPKGDILDRSYNDINVHNLRAQLNYNKEINKHAITSILGAEVKEANYTSNSYRLYGFDDDLVTFSNVDYVNTYPNFITKSLSIIPNNFAETDKTNRFVSVYANASYTYSQRYILSASFRKDASNLFGVETNKKWTPLWSAGISWIISNEKFYKAGLLPYLKFRASYGISGNVDQSKSGVTTIRYLNAASVAGLTQAQVNQFPDPSLRWEKIAIGNFGIDFRTSGDILNGSIELFFKKGSDLFGAIPVDYTTGLGVLNLSGNVADIKGHGIDLNINSRILSGPVQWDVSALLSYNNIRVSKYYLSSDAGFLYVSNGSAISPVEGMPVYSILSYPWAGLDDQGNPQGVIDGRPSTDYASITGSGIKVGDLVYSGPAMPPLYGSVTNTFTYKRFALSFNIGYKLKYYFRRESLSYSQLFQNTITHSDYSLRWQQPGDEKLTDVPSLIYPNDSRRDAFYTNAEILVTRGDHIRLNFINLACNLKCGDSQKFPFRQFQVYLNAADLGILWKANKYNIDPDNIPMVPGKKIAAGIRATLN